MGTKYNGGVENGRMESEEKVAEYVFPNGTVYKGTFKNGCFHGKGELKFPGRGTYKGCWNRGELVSGEYVFEDGLKHAETAEWYCTEKDRRYYGEHLNGIPAAGASLIRSNEEKARSIPPGTYDCLNGYFDPKTGKVHAYEQDQESVVEEPSTWEKEIIRNRAFCSSAPNHSH